MCCIRLSGTYESQEKIKYFGRAIACESLIFGKFLLNATNVDKMNHSFDILSLEIWTLCDRLSIPMGCQMRLFLVFFQCNDIWSFKRLLALKYFWLIFFKNTIKWFYNFSIWMRFCVFILCNCLGKTRRIVSFGQRIFPKRQRCCLLIRYCKRINIKFATYR